MPKYIVHGGRKLSGTYKISGAKNAGPKLIFTALLSDKPCIYHNIPRISDTFRSIDAITAIGGKVRFIARNSIEVDCSKAFSHEIPQEAMDARQSVLFIGTALARFGKAKVYPLKGDKIGKRPINRHFDGIKTLGGSVENFKNHINLTMPIRPASCTYRFEKSTHCGTENLILASVFNKGNVILENCAQEPEVNNMIETLNAMGAKIKRIQERTIEVKGVKPPLGSCEATSIYDRLEMGTAIILAVLNNGNITIENCDEKLLTVLVDTLQKIGVTLRFHGNKAEVANIELPLKPAEIETDWHPGFMTDWQPLMTMLLGVMSQGRSSIHEKIFEDRFHYLRELNKMGVRYRRYRPRRYVAQDYNFNDSEYREQDLHAAYVWGPTTLKPARMISTDVRAGINELIAAVIARGESEIDDPSGHIDRGYESIVEKFTNLGADILRI